MKKRFFGGINMKNEDERTSKGLNQIFEIINAKGDEGELKSIVEQSEHEDDKARNNE
jgi:hypothetical protein